VQTAGTAYEEAEEAGMRMFSSRTRSNEEGHVLRELREWGEERRRRRRSSCAKDPDPPLFEIAIQGD
jgi:hypothetical protein